jgi:hypothetical protein
MVGDQNGKKLDPRKEEGPQGQGGLALALS